MIKGTDADAVISVLEKIGLNKRKTVREVTLDLSSTMMKIARKAFPNAYLTNDRFHVQRLFYEAIDDLRISYRWMARDIENEEIRKCKITKPNISLSDIVTATQENNYSPERNTFLPRTESIGRKLRSSAQK